MAYGKRKKQSGNRNRSYGGRSRSGSRRGNSRSSGRGVRRSRERDSRTIRIVLEQPGMVNRDNALQVPVSEPKVARF